jgi:hypothetical protein
MRAEWLGAERLGNDEDCRKWNNDSYVVLKDASGDIEVSVGERCLEPINSFKNVNVSMVTVP